MATRDSRERWWLRKLEGVERALPKNPLDTVGFLLEAVGVCGLYFIAITGFSGLVWIVPALDFAGLDTRGIPSFVLWLGTILASLGLLAAGTHIRRRAT